MRCIHCLKDFEEITDDHVFPRGWFPDSTPKEVQYWTAPSCLKCNNDLGKKEENIFSRLALTADPTKVGSSGIAERALRGYGVRANTSPKEGLIRERKRQKMIQEITNFSGPVNLLPGTRVPELKNGHLPPLIPIDGGVVRDVYQKIIRGCEYVLEKRYVEEPYIVEIYDKSTMDAFNNTFLGTESCVELGPGFNIKRLYSPEDPLSVVYEITFWGEKKIYGMIINPNF